MSVRFHLPSILTKTVEPSVMILTALVYFILECFLRLFARDLAQRFSNAFSPLGVIRHRMGPVQMETVDYRSPFWQALFSICQRFNYWGSAPSGGPRKLGSP